ncbi:hypothetical protein OUZ56_031751 [Daphnia magna]|uniref:Uncharacterized protein n=1 Tax=Daphnia magna TaxID=35525 RepID=A0ABQ9ZV38_9CRUS|nr:hypothetical protein OUZ56_031751 [Daphnia magna]
MDFPVDIVDSHEEDGDTFYSSPSGEVKYSSCFCGQITDTPRDMLAERLNRLMPGGLVLLAANELSTLGDVTDDEN